MQYVSLVTILLLIQYLIFTMMVGAARSKSGIKAPAVTGDEHFECAYRVQMNTLEQLVMTLPALWLSGLYFEPFVAAALGLTDEPDEVGQIARFAGSLGNVERVDVLPFHQLGRYKWDKLGIEYKLGNTEPPSAEAVEQVCSIFRAEGLKTY